MVHSSDSSVLFVLPFLIHFQLQLREHMEQILEDSYTGMTMWVGLNLFACYFHIFNTFLHHINRTLSILHCGCIKKHSPHKVCKDTPAGDFGCLVSPPPWYVS